jgi:flagellar hook-basal body complex protein FliE
MSTPEIDQVLAQMRIAKAQAGGLQPAEQTAPAEFGELLQKSIDAVNDTQQTAGALRRSFDRGDEGIDLAQVMIAAQKSSVSFEAMVAVRNKLVQAYQNVMRMPI